MAYNAEYHLKWSQQYYGEDGEYEARKDYFLSGVARSNRRKYEHSEKGRATTQARNARNRQSKLNFYKSKRGYAIKLEQNARRRAVLRGLKAGDRRPIQRIYLRAAQLRQWFNVVVDHIIPLNKGGDHIAGNLQIIYARENNQKHARLDYIPSVVFV